MNKRQFQRLSSDEQHNEMRRLARAVNSELNLFGQETVDELMAAARDQCEAEAYIADLLTPGPDFPRWFCEDARPTCNQFLRVARYWRGD